MIEQLLPSSEVIPKMYINIFRNAEKSLGLRFTKKCTQATQEKWCQFQAKESIQIEKGICRMQAQASVEVVINGLLLLDLLLTQT
jgi:hypothetical protein